MSTAPAITHEDPFAKWHQGALERIITARTASFCFAPTSFILDQGEFLLRQGEVLLNNMETQNTNQLHMYQAVYLLFSAQNQV